MLTQELVHSLVDYHPDGYLIWKVGGGSKKIGKRAGSFDKTTKYHRIWLNNSHHKLHRVIFLYHHGYLPKEIDHIDGNPSNNKIENLRACTKSQNNFNRSLSPKSTSGFKGVCWRKDCNKWQAYINVNSKRISLGMFKNIEDAAEAYKKASLELHKEFSIYFNCSNL